MKDHHEESQALWEQAEVAERENFPKSYDLYRQAAEQELLAVDAVDPERPRWRAMLSVSATALFHRAGDLDRVTQLADRFVEELELTDRQIFQLKEMRDIGQKIRSAIALTKNTNRTNEEEAELKSLFRHLNRYEIQLVDRHQVNSGSEH